MSDRPTAATTAFLEGGGECARLIGARDWSETPLGPIATWPQSLKTATALLLRSPVPIVMLWGEDGVMIYNDAYSVFAGGRHPELLGSRVREGWPEVADFNDNVMRVGLAGGTLAYRDQELTLYRHGRAEQVWMNLDYSPVLDESGRPAGVLAIILETTERVNTERYLRAERERLNAVLEGINDCFYALDRDWRFIVFNRACEAYFGVARREVLGRDIWQLFPQGVGTDFERLCRAAMAEGRSAAIETPSRLRPDRFVELRVAPMGEAGISVAISDITERKLAEAQLRESEARMRLATEAAEVGFWDVDVVNNQLIWPASIKAMFGISPDVAVSMADFYGGLHPDDRDATSVAFAAASDPSRRAIYDVEYRTVGKEDGVVRWIAAKGRGVFDASGRCTRVIGVAIDISERKRAELHQRLLVNELNHRVKNTLAIVQSLAQQSFRNASVATEARAAFEGRLAALSAAHNVLTRENWEAASMHRIIGDAVAPYRGTGDAFVIDGPDVALVPKTAVSLALAMHELATNAVKYGALSVPPGGVEIRWRVKDERLRLTWRESGGPRVTSPTRRGFGSRMIERGLAAELGGSVKIDFKSSGVVCTVEAPLPGAHA